MSAIGSKADIAQEDVMEFPDIGPCRVATILGIIDDGDVRQAVCPGKLRNNPAVPLWHRFDRDIERGEEIQDGKARCPGAKEEGDEEGEAG
jgi:hypothetical protein